MPNGRFLGKVPTPLEVVDAGLDTVAEVIQLPARAGSNLFNTGQRTADRIKAAIDRPKDYAQVPAPPDVLLEGGLDALSGAASGVVEGIGGIFDAVQKTGEGVRRQIDGLIRR
jgi:hypothetical protein